MIDRIDCFEGVRHAAFMAMVRSEFLRVRRSPLVALHAALAAAIGLAAGLYFAATSWDSLLAYDAFVQLLGAGASLLAGISCGLSLETEREAGDYANLAGHPSRRKAFCAKGVVLLGMGSLACLAALFLFVGVLMLAGKPVPSAGIVALTFVALTAGSVALYVISIVVALIWGRNAAITIGALGFMVALASLGGLGNGLVTGTLSASIAPLALMAVPFTWPARLASLSVEIPLAAAGRVPGTDGMLEALASNTQASIALCAVGTAIVIAAWMAYVSCFEDTRRTKE